MKTVAWFISHMCEVLLKLDELPGTRNTTHTFMFYSFLKYLADNVKPQKKSKESPTKVIS